LLISWLRYPRETPTGVAAPQQHDGEGPRRSRAGDTRAARLSNPPDRAACHLADISHFVTSAPRHARPIRLIARRLAPDVVPMVTTERLVRRAPYVPTGLIWPPFWGNLLEPSAGSAAAEAAAAGWAVLVREAVANGRLTAAGGPSAPLTALAAGRGVTEDAIALAQPWASVVLSGAVTRAQLG